jgi:alkaline phosphatase D
MPINRRNFLKTSLAFSAGITLPLPLLAGGMPKTRIRRSTLSIVQGATDESRTQFSIVHPASAEITAHVSSPENERILPDRLDLLKFPGQQTSVTQAFFSGLEPGLDFTLTILGSGGKVLDQRIFQTLDPAKEDFRFAICSCMDDSKHAPEIWQDLAAQAPDLITFIGDSTYADRELKAGETKPEALWRRFSEARATLEIYHLPRLIPILAVWDDHDFGHNDANSSYPYLKESQRNFLTFFPQDPNYCRFLDRGPGISSAFSFRGQRLLLLDDRSYRLEKNSSDRHAHWGREQEAWALAHVRNHENTTWLMNGSQFFPDVFWKESVSRDHPAQFAGLLQELRNTGRRVVFASGDVHYSEISRIEPEMLGYETFEITSSSIHSSLMPGFPGLVPNGRRILSTGNRNYVLVDGKGPGSYRVQSRSAGKRVNFEREIRL